MARQNFGYRPSEEVCDRAGNVRPGATVTIWDAETAGTQITDLVALGTATVLAGTITTDTYGRPTVQGPDGIYQMWAQSGSGNGRWLLESSTAYTSAAAAVITHNADAAAHPALSARWGAWTGFVAAGGTFGASFTDYGGALRAVQIRRSLDLVNVQLRGVGKASGAIVVGATILTVPAGYRPAATEVFAMGTDRAATQQYCRVDIASTGVITFAAAGNLASGELISFSGMAWSTA